MTSTLICKLLRDVRVALIVVLLLLCAFEVLWARVTNSIAAQILPVITQSIPLPQLRETIFKGPGKIVETLIGGEDIDLSNGQSMISIGFIHPLIQTILCIWAIGRAAGAVAGEIDRGTMELLLAQPLRRGQIILSHLMVDLLTIPLLCLALWGGAILGAHLVGLAHHAKPQLRVNPWLLWPALPSVAVLVFALSGLTMWLSAAGRFRWRVLGLATLLALVMFLVNVIGQLWEPAAPFRPFTLFYYFQPQHMLKPAGFSQGIVWLRLGVLLGVGALGYLMAWWTFQRRDVPAPL